MTDENSQVTDDQVIRETGESFAFWGEVLDELDAGEKDQNEIVVFLQLEHGIDRYWARALATRYLKEREGSEGS